MEDFLLSVLIFGLPALSMLTACGLAWSGRWRTWAPKPPGPFIFARRNYDPMYLGVGGVAVLCIWPAVFASLARAEYAETLWTLLLVIFVPIVFGMRWWWPAAVTPRWHKEWVARGGTEETPLWGPGEQVPARAARKGWA